MKWTKSFVPGTNVPYENWLQAWMVTLRSKKRNQSEPDLKKKILYIDMDSVLVDFIGAFDKLDKDLQEQYKHNKDEVPGMFGQMLPLEGALDAFDKLSEKYDVYILSSAPWKNPSAWSDKLEWVKKHLGPKARKRLILSHHKHLNRGDYLIDDRPNNGAKHFQGEWLRFGEKGDFPDWKSVLDYLL